MEAIGLNVLDLFLLFILFIGLLIGLLRGVIPQVISLLSMWLALLASLWTYKLFSDNILQGLDIGRLTSDTIAFLTMLFVFFQAIRLFVKYLLKPPEEKKKPPKKAGRVGPIEAPKRTGTQRFIVGPLNALAGIFLGILLTSLWLAIILGVFQFFFQEAVFNAQTPAGSLSAPGLAGQLRSSTLVYYFNQILWVLVQSVSLFVIDKDANILQSVVDFVLTPQS
jgi:uncharacterized membrane protein required for colicin V production